MQCVGGIGDKQAASCSYQEYIHRPKSMSVREQLQSMAYQEVRYFADGLAWLACVFMQKLLDYSSQAIGRRQAAMSEEWEFSAQIEEDSDLSLEWYAGKHNVITLGFDAVTGNILWAAW